MNQKNSDYSIIALIPARSGSKRIPDKNIKLLGEHPLMAYTIKNALESGIFKKIICVTDSYEYGEIAAYYGAEVPILRPKTISTDFSPDIDWLKWIIGFLERNNFQFDAFSILRPTSPFRHAKTIKKAWQKFLSSQPTHSLRAIQKCKEHPGKMWKIEEDFISPILEGEIDGNPFHSSQYSSLPEIFVQNASLEIAWSHVPAEFNSISGEFITPFISENIEGFDINHDEDWIIADHYLKSGDVTLPTFNEQPFNLKRTKK